MKKFFFFIFFFKILIFQAYSQNACFLLSKKLKPYIEMVNGFSENYQGKVRIYDLSESEFFTSSLKSCDIAISAGNKANNFLKKAEKINKKIFTFLIYKNEAENFIKDNQSFAIYLYPPPEKWLPFFKKEKINYLIAPYSNKKVKTYLKKASAIFKNKNINLKIIKTDVFDKFEAILKTNKKAVLWMLPDNLYSSVDIINYLIEKATFFKMRTIGFNTYFYKAGATYSIVINYKKIGNVIKNRFLKNIDCKVVNAPFNFLGINNETKSK